MTDELSDEPEKWYRDAVLGFIEEENTLRRAAKGPPAKIEYQRPKL